MKHWKCEKTTRKRFSKWKNKILWGITYLAFLILIVSASALDSAEWLNPFMAMVISFTWLCIFFDVNADKIVGKK